MPNWRDMSGFTSGKVTLAQALGLPAAQVPALAATLPTEVEQAEEQTAQGAATGAAGQAVTATGGSPSGGTDAQNQKLGQQLAAPYGWGSGAEWTALNNLVMAESGWNNNAQNPTSTAFGIGQFLDTTWATVGGTKTTDATTQINLMLKYIKVRYGTPIAAWAHEQTYHWY